MAPPETRPEVAGKHRIANSAEGGRRVGSPGTRFGGGKKKNRVIFGKKQMKT